MKKNINILLFRIEIIGKRYYMNDYANKFS